MEMRTFYDERTSTLTYVVCDPQSRDAVVIDPVLDYEPGASKTFTESVDRVIRYLKDERLKLRYILETHPHADHLSGSQRIKEVFPEAQIAISDGISTVQQTFKEVFDLPEDFPTDGSQFDRLLTDRERLVAGSLELEVINTPGHTPACVTYKIGDALFTGDALFMPDSGTGRCDFPGGSANDIYSSVTERLYTLPEETRVFVGHDYQPGGRELAYASTIGEQKRDNMALPAGKNREAFVAWRERRDASLAAPKLLFQSVQVNVAAGRMPDPAANGRRYLKIPINVFRPDPAPSPDAVEYTEVPRTRPS
jgi:glyoxylase-like metal-dependent hydrolase (beta-lactamase superfamily II)